MSEFDPWTHEVDFHKYCPTCKNWDDAVYPNPCDECLNHPMNDSGSRKPIMYELDERKVRVKNEV